MKKILFLVLASCFLVLNSQAFGQDFEFDIEAESKTLEEIASERYTIHFRDDEGRIGIVPKIDRETKRRNPVPFGSSPFTLEDRIAVENALNLNGTVLRIWDSINAVLVRTTPEEAERLRRRPDVLLVEQSQVLTLAATQSNPGWALDRLDEQFPAAYDNSYNYSWTGIGQDIYFVDTGLDEGAAFIDAEFGAREDLIHDFNSGGTGADCHSHGTHVTSVAAGATYGVAKGANVKMAKVTTECSGSWVVDYLVDSLIWLATYEDRGTILNVSLGYDNLSCPGYTNTAIENAIVDATDAGILVFTAAGNSKCDIGDINWLDIPENFVVGGLQDYSVNWGAPSNQDRRWNDWDYGSNYGANISTWAPAQHMRVLHDDGEDCVVNQTLCGNPRGTSYAAPMVAGIAAIACQYSGSDCSTYSVLDLYNAFRAHGQTGTVYDQDGTALPGSSPSRVIWNKWW